MKIILNEHQLNIIKESIELPPYQVPIPFNEQEATIIANKLQKKGVTFDAKGLVARLGNDYIAEVVQPNKDLNRALEERNKNDIESQYASFIKAVSNTMNYLVRQQPNHKGSFLELFVRVESRQHKNGWGSTYRENKYGEGSILRFFLMLLNNPYVINRLFTRPETKEELQIGTQLVKWKRRADEELVYGIVPMESYIENLKAIRGKLIMNSPALRAMANEAYVPPEYDTHKVAEWEIWKPVE
mgnify:CR=1 FL=1